MVAIEIAVAKAVLGRTKQMPVQDGVGRVGVQLVKLGVVRPRLPQVSLSEELAQLVKLRLVRAPSVPMPAQQDSLDDRGQR